jgi:hypothetical protein
MQLEIETRLTHLIATPTRFIVFFFPPWSDFLRNFLKKRAEHSESICILP